MYRPSRAGAHSVLHRWTALHQHSASRVVAAAALPLAVCAVPLSAPLHVAALHRFSTASSSSSSSPRTTPHGRASAPSSSLTSRCTCMHSSRRPAVHTVSVRHYTRKKKRTAGKRDGDSGAAAPQPLPSRAQHTRDGPPTDSAKTAPPAQSADPEQQQQQQPASVDDSDDVLQQEARDASAEEAVAAESSPDVEGVDDGVDETPLWDGVLPGDADFSADVGNESFQEEQRAFESEMAARRYRARKRPDRSPFHPLPDTYDDDEEVDLPHELTMSRAVYDDLTEDEQHLIRTHQGLLRLRRNEQKLQRILSMEKADRLDLLMLLNELEHLGGLDRRMHEKYVGPKLGWEDFDHMLEPDLDLLYTWEGLERTDETEIVGDSTTVEQVRELRAEDTDEEKGSDGQDEGSAERSALITSEAVGEAEEKLRSQRVAARKRRAVDSGDPADAFEPEDPVLQRMRRQHQELLKVRAERERQPAIHEPPMRADVEEAEMASLPERFPDGFEEDYMEDEFLEADADKDLEMEVDLLMGESSGVGSLQLTAEGRRQMRREREELSKDESVQAWLGGADNVKLALSKKLTKKQKAQLASAALDDDEELALLEEHSGVWRIKQEIVAEMRSALKAAGTTLDDAKVAEFMAEEDESTESALREIDDVQRDADLDDALHTERVLKQIRRQKRWLTELREEFGEERVRQLVREGHIQLKTYAALNAVLRDHSLRSANQGLSMLEQIEQQLQGLDEQVADVFGISVDDVRKLGESADAEVAIPSAEALANRDEQLRDERAMREHHEHIRMLVSMTQRDLVAEADAAEKDGDTLAARKLRCMHRRRTEYAEADDPRRVGSPTSEQLQGMAPALVGTGGKGDEEGPQAIEQARFGVVTAEEAKINRALIARGDGNSARFTDEDVSDAALDDDDVGSALLLPPDSLRSVDDSDVDDGEDVEDAERPERSAADGDGNGDTTARGEALVAANNAAYREYMALSEEKKLELSDKEEREQRDELDEFDDYVLMHLPLKLHKKAVRDWKRLSEADQRKAVLEGRNNREELRAWMDQKAVQHATEGEEPDPLSQYYISENDPKIYNALEGAFWHVGRWGLDERTDEQRLLSLERRIVPRFKPDTPDTQTLLDAVEEELFAVDDDTYTEEDIDKDEEMNDEDRAFYKDRLRDYQRDGQPPEVRSVDVEVDPELDARKEDAEDLIAAQEHPKEGVVALDTAAVEVIAEREGIQEEPADEEAKSEEVAAASSDVEQAEVGETGEGEKEEEALLSGAGEAGDGVEEGAEEKTVVEEEKEMTDPRDVFDLDDEESDDPDAMAFEDSRRRAPVADEQDAAEQRAAADDDGSVSASRSRTGEESALQLRKRAEAEERQRLYRDFDPVPASDQRAFDDRYLHYDEEDWALLHKVDPLGVARKRYQPPISEQTVTNEYLAADIKGQNVLSADTRRALYYLHRSNPSVWTPSALAMRFRMSHMHVKGLLLIEATERRQREHGVEQPDPDDDDAAERLGPREVDMSEMHSFISAMKFKAHMTRRGHDGEIIPIFDREGRRTHHTEAMLHFLPRLARPRVADVRFVSENDLQAVLDEERDIEERFLNHQQRQARREAEEYKRTGSIGTPTHPRYTRKVDPQDTLQHPEVIEAGQLLPPVNHHVVLTDITERSRDRFSLAVRDVTGYLRQPTPVEFMAVRRREKSEKGRFVHVQFTHEKDTPL